MAARKPAKSRPEKVSTVQVRLMSPAVNKLTVISAYLKGKEGREYSIAETLQYVAGDVVDAFYVKALRELQENVGKT